MTPGPIARAIVRIAAQIVPKWRRREWRREWEAELSGPMPAGNGMDLVARSVGSVVDAAFLRSQTLSVDLWRGDFRSAWRTAVRDPGFTLLVVMTLALGLAAGTAVFAVADATVLRPLPYRDPQRLVFIWQTLPQESVFDLEATPFDFMAWRRARSFSSLGLVALDTFTLTGNSEAERVRGARVSASLLPLLGIAPQIGRGFSVEEDDDAAGAVVILSDGLWRRRFGADRTAIGRAVPINGVPHIIVGVMQPSAHLPGRLGGNDDVWLPIRMAPAERDNEVSHNFTIVARLADGVSLEGASKEMAAVADALAHEHPDTHQNIGVRLESVAAATTKPILQTLIVLLGSVVLLIMIASANVATLLLVRASRRAHETALRAAVGATRARLVSLSVAESVSLAALAGLVAVVLGDRAIGIVVPQLGASIPASAAVQIDARSASVTMVVAVVIGVVLGLIVGRRAQATDLAATLRSGSRMSPARNVTRARDGLVIAQVALAVVLLGAAGLLVRSVVRLAHINPGFAGDRVLTWRLSLDTQSYENGSRRIAFVNSLLARLQSASPIERAAITSRIPLGGSRGANGVDILDRPPAKGRPIIIDQRHVSTGYFHTLGIRLLRGRSFLATDTSESEQVAIINKAMADRYWPNVDPIDQKVRVSTGFDSGVWFRVVGIVDDVRHISLSLPAVPEMYRPYTQAPVPDFIVVVRTREQPTAAAPTVRQLVHELDPNLAMYDLRSMEDRVAASFSQVRATTLLLTATAIVAAVLAGIAIYGAIWYSVSDQIPEIGLRLALGATPASLCARIVRRAFLLSGAGASIGVAVAIPAGSLLGALLFDTTTTDLMTYVIVVTAVLALTLAASVAPARRAMAVDPLTAMRD